jgi:hypothetical protein
MIFGHCRLNDWMRAESIGMAPFLLATFVLNIVYLQQAFKELSPSVKAVRIGSLVMGVASIIVLSVSLQPHNQARGVTMQSISQIVFFLMILVYLVTLRIEIAQLKVDVQILTE